MSVRVEVEPEVLAWARERSGYEVDELNERFPKLKRWEQRELTPTLNELEEFARATHTSIGFFFLQTPPIEGLSIQDFRTIGGVEVSGPSADLLDTIAICEERQEWYRQYMVANGEDLLEFVGSLTESVPVVEAARRIHDVLGFDLRERVVIPTWTEALTKLSSSAEDAGVLVMISGIVGSNTKRKLDTQEFRGFALSDIYAPLVFINGTDSKAAKIFTLVHELVHLWLGQSAVSNVALNQSITSVDSKSRKESWCNAVAAEFLVPQADFERQFNTHTELQQETSRLAKRYKVSNLVVLKRAYEAKFLSWDQFQSAYKRELQRTQNILKTEGQGGGNFYKTQPVRVSRRFARAIISDTLEGRTLYRDAFRMLGFRSKSAFDGLAHELSIA
jgi:Zn-dependent peptidase ImmA (M78 family)